MPLDGAVWRWRDGADLRVAAQLGIDTASDLDSRVKSTVNGARASLDFPALQIAVLDQVCV